MDCACSLMFDRITIMWWSLIWGCSWWSVLWVLWWYKGVGLGSFFGEVIFLDELSGSLGWLVVLVCALSVLGSGSILVSGESPMKFLVTILVLMVILVMCFGAGSFLVFYVTFEAGLIPVLVIVYSWGYQPERLQAGKYLMMYTVSASLPLLVSIVWVYEECGSTSFNLCASSMVGVGWLILLSVNVAFLVKLPVYGVHLWLPKAHVEAPVSGSMLLAGVLLKLGGYGLVRFSSLVGSSGGFFLEVVVCLGLFGGFLASAACCAQSDMKALVAYSSVGHMSMVLGGVFSNTIWGLNGVILLMVGHGLCSAGLFFAVSEMYKLFGSRMLFMVRGSSCVMPSFGLGLFFLSTLNAAAPPSMNLCGEIMLCVSILSYSLLFGVIIGVLGFLCCLYSWLLYCGTQHGGFPWWVRSSLVVGDNCLVGTLFVSVIFPLVGFFMMLGELSVG
uniref:NADH-ubiquinone oxidoreductase chain 4 n=1 Tax=Margaritifera margaritifera TaxID=2505931 RepID=A0A4Y5QSG5_9BIVA|nr:NADH dehydrogenase subunit 4 [Margaritifera margaritifera]